MRISPPEEQRIREKLRYHWLVGIVCDEKTHTDRPLCACSRVDLGAHPSVGAAVDAWIEHVLGPGS